MNCPVCKKECANLDDLMTCVSVHKKAEEEQKKQLLKAEQSKRLAAVNAAYDAASKAYENANKVAQAYCNDYPNEIPIRHIEIPFGRLVYSDGFSLDDLVRDIRSAFGYASKAGSQC
jgi:hypothetical protein